MSKKNNRKDKKRSVSSDETSTSTSIASADSNYSTAEFFESVKRFGWQGFFKKLPSEDLIITNAAFKKELLIACGELACGIVELHELEAALKEHAGRLILFLPRHERAIQKSLQAYQPRRRIYSVIADLMPNSLHRPATLAWRRDPQPVKIDAGQDCATPVFIIGSPGSEVSYFADVYQRSGLGDVRPYLPNSIPIYKEMTGGFPIARFMHAISTRYVEDNGFTCYVYANVVKQMLESKVFSLSRLIEYLQKSNARIIYYSMRDKIRQAIYAATFESRTTDSVWELSKEARASYKAPSVTPVRLVRTLLPLIEQDLEAEQLLRALPRSYYVTHEDLVMAPREVMTGVAKHIGRPLQHDVNDDWYEVTQSVMPNLAKDTDALTRLVIDRLGLHANAAGSLVSLQQLVGEIIDERMAQQD